MRNVTRWAAVAAVAVLLAVPAASQAQTYVGSWQVDQGPVWSGSPPNGPLAYTGQEAAALLFGGSPSDYFISTVDNNPGNINYMSWYSIIGWGGGTQFAENYFNKYLGLYYGPTTGYAFSPNSPASSFVWDNAQGSTYTNYAFRVTPEPASILLLGTGLIGVVGAFRRRKVQA